MGNFCENLEATAGEEGVRVLYMNICTRQKLLLAMTLDGSQSIWLALVFGKAKAGWKAQPKGSLVVKKSAMIV